MQELIDALGTECPRRILGLLHSRGEYRHRVFSGGKIGCFHRDSDCPELAPSAAQAALWDAQAGVLPEKECGAPRSTDGPDGDQSGRKGE